MGAEIETAPDKMEMEPLDLSVWQKVVEIIQAAFWEGCLTEESMCQAVVGIPVPVSTTPGVEHSYDSVYIQDWQLNTIREVNWVGV